MIVLKYISYTIGIAGVAIITWGTIITFLRLLRCEFYRIKGNRMCLLRHQLRRDFGSYILLGLEFLIVADIIMTFLEPTLMEMALLGSIVVIRTIISYFLNKEIEVFEKSFKTEVE